MTTKAMILHNPAAGQRDRSDELHHLVEFLRGRGWEVADTRQTTRPGEAADLARDAVRAGCDVLFVAGGDGTLAQAADGLVGSETALAVLPSGTGNVMAKQLGLPAPGGLWQSTYLDAAQVLLDGETRRIDVGQVSLSGGHVRHFLCWCGVGFDAQVNLAVNEVPERKQRLGRLAFIVAALLTVRDFAGTRAVVRIDGRRVSRRLLMLVASNIQLYGVWFRIAPRAILDDGWFDVYAFQGRGAAESLFHAFKVLVNFHVQDPAVSYHRARRIEIAAARPLPLHVDGEHVGYTPVVIRVLPQALKLLVPRAASASLFLEGMAEQTEETPWHRMSRLARDAQAVLTGKNDAG